MSSPATGSSTPAPSHTLERLDSVHRLTVELLAVAWEELPRGDVFKWVTSLSLARYLPNPPRTAAAFNPVIDALHTLGLVVATRTKVQISPLAAHAAMRSAWKGGRLPTLIQLVQSMSPAESGWQFRYTGFDRLIRELRLGAWSADESQFNRALQALFAHALWGERDTLRQVFASPFDPEWFSQLPAGIVSTVAPLLLDRVHRTLEPALELVKFVQQPPANMPAWMKELGIQDLLLRGLVEPARQALLGVQVPTKARFEGWIKLLEGQVDEAAVAFEEGLAAWRKLAGKRKYVPADYVTTFHLLALLGSSRAEHKEAAKAHLAALSKQGLMHLPGGESLDRLFLASQGQRWENMPRGLPPDVRSSHPLQALLWYQEHSWMRAHPGPNAGEELGILVTKAVEGGFHWLACAAGELMIQYAPEQAHQEGTLREARARLGIKLSLNSLMRATDPWERTLAALKVLGQSAAPAPEAAQSAFSQRLVWWLALHRSWHVADQEGIREVKTEGVFVRLEPREQKLDARGNWTRGRACSLKRLYEDRESMPWLSPQDVTACQAIRHHTFRSWGRMEEEYALEPGAALVALAGSPLLFWADDPSQRVEVVVGTPELTVTRSQQSLEVRLEPATPSMGEHVIYQEAPNRLRVVQFQERHLELAKLLGREGLKVPASALERVKETIGLLSGVVTVHSDVGGGTTLEEVPSDARPVFRLSPLNTGLRIEQLVKPFGATGQAFRPGVGSPRLLGELDGRRVQTRRDLSEELRLGREALQLCPGLQGMEDLEGVWNLDDTELALDALVQLKALGDRVTLEWPQGESLKVTREQGSGSLKVRLKNEESWFEAQGSLQVEADLTLSLEQLLELAANTPARYIPLGEGKFLALTRELHRRLRDLSRLRQRHGKRAGFHPLLTGTVQELLEGIDDLQVDSGLAERQERLKEAMALTPDAPPTLQTELRPYQLEGFRWLARLAHWGVGACLADDMGLGKTIQALALLLLRAADGPALVVAPTSVALNWLDEARHFAPTLEVTLFGPGDRAQVVAGQGPFSVLVCSYTMLQLEADLLSSRSWHTVILDEAQAIKNAATRRSQAAMRLEAGFRLATTGTPIENHLGELWNLYRFLNPGLLGSSEHFNAQFAVPIEKNQDRVARAALKRMIQPFILRRTKNQVLEELPPRTEIVRLVELSSEEAALYEAVRRQAVATLTNEPGGNGSQHLRILAELMRLRRAACHPKLVLPTSSLDSAKLIELEFILEELQENRHKALIFSQFVDHLTLTRERLEEKKIAYQYLDGSTPMHERRRAIEAFQRGEGDVFLISLKAGGLGLNLTAADYVIHLDPWWNPAVEDQASDRAHRIGQSRPVTIYRLVARGTIEEKIVALHHHKRDLADSLLEGTNISSRLTEAEMMALLEGN